jgi:parvulin-like peptidyl-prolyl isomerase
MMLRTASTALVLAALAAGCDQNKETAASAAAASAAAASAAATTSAAAAPSVPAPPQAAPSASSAASADAPPPDTIIAQHILVEYKGASRAAKSITRSKAEAKARAAEALAKVRSGTPFEDVVKQYSDDEGSVDRMGSVGKFHRNERDATFSAAAFALKPGGVSDVVETQFGFHIIKRTQ